MQELDKSDLVVSVLHLKDASMLLKRHEPTISQALLKLAKAIVYKNGILSADIQDSETLAEEISNGTSQEKHIC